jgi:6-phosphofructokinase 1
MRIGILTGGGDCPGLNAVIRAVVRTGRRQGHEHVGLLGGWRGLLERDTVPLDHDAVSGILQRGGTILKSSRTNPYSRDGGPQAAVDAMAGLGLDALVAIGGEDTLGVASKLHGDFGAHVVGVPKTIDNDLSGTDYTFGFWTSVQIAVDVIDRLHSTAESHDRVIVVEVMGRHAGWLALESGLAGGADAILIPEVPTSVASVCGHVMSREARGRRFSIIVVSEGVLLDGAEQGGERDEFGHVALAKVGVGERLAMRIKDETGKDARSVVIGHTMRGGSPIAYDRALATRYGVRAAEMVDEGLWGRMAALRGTAVIDVPLAEAVGTLKTVPEDVYRVAEPFFG